MRPSTRALAPVAATVALTWALAGCSSGDSGSGAGSGSGAAVTSVDGVQRLDVAAFAGLAASPTTIVLDVRTPEEFAAGHLPRAQVLDFHGADFATRLAALDRSATYAIYCRSGNRSGQALEQMKAAGFTHIADLREGVVAWQNAGRELTTN